MHLENTLLYLHLLRTLFLITFKKKKKNNKNIENLTVTSFPTLPLQWYPGGMLEELLELVKTTVQQQ